MKKWRAKRKSEGKPVISTKLPREWHAEYERKYANRPGVRTKRNKQQEKYRNDPRLRIRHLGRWLTRNAINRGELKRKPCEVCGVEKVDAHHDDYTKPLQIRWLCRKHHAEYHRKAKEGA